MKVLKHIFEQPFVFATGLAALIHSTWSLATLFAGEQPSGTLGLIGWLSPALLIAFALDVGQIATSVQIRRDGLTVGRGVAFAVFAFATYYLQWLYIAHHMPALELGAGVRGDWSSFATLVRDAAVWIIPALLPLSTLLYTFSGSSQPAPAPGAAVQIGVSQLATLADDDLSQLPMLLPQIEKLVDEHFVDPIHRVTCPSCGTWTKTYATAESARRGLALHQARHCTAMHPEFSTNGSAKDE